MFRLDSQLESDTIGVIDLPLSSVLMMNHQDYPWLILVPRREAMVEIIDLDELDRKQLMNEICLASHVLKTSLTVQKINIGSLGNKVHQLHVHVVGRNENDPAWPNPVWGQAQRPYEPAALQEQQIFFKNAFSSFL